MVIKNAEILCVGTEILIGDIVNTNAAFISRELADMGISQYYQGAVGDNPARLKEQILSALDRCDLLIMSGGLGPTYDDLTKEIVAECMGRELVFDERTYERMTEYFKKSKYKMSENNKKQAYIPVDSVIFDNDNGTAPGCAIEDREKGKIIIMLPGPPRELIPMWNDKVKPYLSRFSEYIIVSQNINICGIGESRVAEILDDMMKQALNPTIAPYCTTGEVRLRVTARAKTREEGITLCRETVEKIYKSSVGEFIYGTDTDLESALVSKLRENSLKIATAESCTGGLISKRITNVAGSSEVFDGGIVSYSNEIKERILGVKESTLAKSGAVSENTVEEMAEGVRKLMNADIGLSVSGIAGPGGGSEEKPVGLVFIGISTKSGTRAVRLDLRGSREHIRDLAAINALNEALKELKKIKR